MSKKAKIFVDGNCLLCSMEISHYKKIAPEEFDIVDISDENFNAISYSLTADAVNQNMHVMTGDGKIKIGVDAFAYIWSRIEKYKFASLIITKPIVYQLACLGYKAFTMLRPYLPKKNKTKNSL